VLKAGWVKSPDFPGDLGDVIAVQDMNGFAGDPQENIGGIDQLGPGHHGVGGFHDLHQGPVVHQLLVLAAAGEKQEGNAGDVLGDGVDAGMHPNVLFIGMRDAVEQ